MNYNNIECYKCNKQRHRVTDCNSYSCYNCGKVGHLAKDCRLRRKIEETTNLALETKSNEGFLLMTQKEADAENDTMWYLDS